MKKISNGETYCYSEKRRELMVEIFDIEPIAHVKLLKGQKKISCTGIELENEYYCFSYKIKGKEGKKETFFSGIGAANHFLKLINHERLPLFNPLINGNNGGAGYGGGRVDDREIENPEMRELLNAINMLITCWNSTPTEPLISIKAEVERSIACETREGLIKSVNTIISKDQQKRTLTEMIDLLRNENDIRNYNFDNLTARLEAKEIKSYF